MIGHQISHFYVMRTLGSGGMGVVYEAQDTRLPRSVAIKVLKDELAKDLSAIRRFKREARLASSLNHPNICTIFEVNDDDSRSFIAMELLEGTSLKARLMGEPPSLAEILDIGSQVADALGAAHAEGILHRDITPGNIFITSDGLVKVLDFGLATHFAGAGGDQATDDLTESGTVAGTIHYMAPEQLAGGEVDHRCDLFALGAVLYELGTGARPFDIQPRSALRAAIERQPHIPMHALAPQHSARLGHIIDVLLAKKPDDRYQSAGALRAELDALRRSQPSAKRSSRAAPATMAVLPFEIVGPADVETVSLRDGIAAELSSRLSRVEQLWMAPRTSVRAVTGHSISELGRRLGVEMIVEGTLQRSQERVRVTATLVDAAEERAVLSPLVVERILADALGTQDAIAQELCDTIAAGLSRTAARRYSKDPEAYHAFKRGRHLWASCFGGGWRLAIEHFQHAINRDPHFALAHVALASAYNFLGFYSLVKPSLAFSVGRRAAERALAIDDSLGSAFIELALARFGGEWDWNGAEQAFRAGLALEPDNPLAHVHYSWLLMLLGREDAALSEARRGLALAPSSRLVSGACAQTMYLGARYEQAIELCGDCLRFDPHYVFAIHVRGLSHLARGENERAIADLEQAATLSQRAPFYLGILGYCYGSLGMRQEALSLIDELNRCSPDVYVAPQCFVFLYAGLDERERALDFQEKAYEDGASPFNYLTPFIRRLYALAPHHKKRLEQMRLVV